MYNGSVCYCYYRRWFDIIDTRFRFTSPSVAAAAAAAPTSNTIEQEGVQGVWVGEKVYNFLSHLHCTLSQITWFLSLFSLSQITRSSRQLSLPEIDMFVRLLYSSTAMIEALWTYSVLTQEAIKPRPTPGQVLGRVISGQVA